MGENQKRAAIERTKKYPPEELQKRMKSAASKRWKGKTKLQIKRHVKMMVRARLAKIKQKDAIKKN